MNGFLLDTNCISEVVRIRPEPNVIYWLENADEQSLYLSVLTLGEIRKGLVNVPQGQRLEKLTAWLTNDLPRRFADRILPVGRAVAELWGTLAGGAKRAGKTIPVVDSILAATALQHNLTVVSRNVADFQIAQVPVRNPWLRST